MRIEAEDYLEAARFRIADAHHLFNGERYSFSLYAAGLAVEALLRAYRILKTAEFDERHDLQLLLEEGNLKAFLLSTEIAEVSGLILLVFRRWKNDFRFASDNRLRRRLKKLHLDRGVRGDYLKTNCRNVLDSASRIVKIGVTRWPQK